VRDAAGGELGAEAVGAGGVAPVVGEVQDGAVSDELGAAEVDRYFVVCGGSPRVGAGQGAVDVAAAAPVGEPAVGFGGGGEEVGSVVAPGSSAGSVGHGQNLVMGIRATVTRSRRTRAADQ
jgi:hypothetical protein